MDRPKRPIGIVLAVALAASGALLVKPTGAQVIGQPIGAYPAAYIPRSMEQLQQLTAPVALYPDAILAQVLVACTYPDDVIAASRWLAAGNSPQYIDSQNWDLSVQGVARYPGTLNYMANNVDWMNDLGDAFLNQQDDVMSAVQVLRAQANAAGNLITNDRQRVVVQGNVITIIPANPELIYVPVYDPRVVFVRRYAVGVAFMPVVTFGVGIRVGAWLHHDFDWHDRSIYVGAWGRERPWWKHDGRDVRLYVDVRPGLYHPTRVTDVREATVIRNVQVGRWQRDAHRPAPRPVRVIDRGPSFRPGSGYSQPKSVILPTHGGIIVAKESDRGRRSLEAAGLRPTPHAEAGPVRRPDVRVESRTVSRTTTVTRSSKTVVTRSESLSARTSGPVRGGAVAGYQNAAAAAQAARRGAASRESTHHTYGAPDRH